MDEFGAVDNAGRQQSPQKQAVHIVAESDKESFPGDEAANAEICICLDILPSQGATREQRWNGTASDIVAAKRERIQQQREAEHNAGGTKTAGVRNEQCQERALTVRQTRTPPY